MKLKQIPEDFQVVELDSLAMGPGPYAVYRLAKSGIGTLEAVSHIAREFGVARRAIAFGGLKDKWGATEQTLTIQGGPARDLRSERFTLSHRGTAPAPMRRGSFERNQFRIAFRDLTDGDVAHLRRAIAEIAESGLPNYFDSQRFGSVKGADDFIGKRLALGDFEGALKLAVATPNADDRSAVRKVKEILRERWGRWGECLEALPPGAYETRLVKILARDPKAFARAFATIDRDLRLLFVSAYQSALWNRILERWVRGHASDVFERDYELGKLVLYHRLEDGAHREQKIPLPRRGVVYEGELREIADAVLKEEGLELAALKIRGMRDLWFGRGDRAAIVRPQAMSVEGPSPDELNAGRLKAVAAFELPRGSYATILVKRVFH